LLRILARKKVRILIIDPARKYIVGDEDSSGPVNDFYSLLETFARETGAAVAIVHHLVKGKPHSLDDVRRMVRGSGVHIDRPRIALGMYHKGDRTVIGAIKSNLPPDCKLLPEAELCRDPRTLRHTPIVSTAARSEPGIVRAPDEAQALPTLVFAELSRLLAAGERVTCTGRHSLYERRLPALAGLSRRQLAAVVDGLIASGVLAETADGLRVR
jgi:hypothetical protein